MDTDTTMRAGASADVGGTVQPVMQQLQEKAGDLAEQARGQIKHNLANQTKRTSRSLDRVAHALRETGQHMKEENEPKFGEAAEKAADWIEDFAADLRDRDIDQMFRSVETFGRQRPAVFLGGAFLLGFLAARFLKASRDASGAMQQFPRTNAPSTPSDYSVPARPSSVAATSNAPSLTPAPAPAPSSYSGAPAGDAYSSAERGINSTYGSTAVTDTAEDEADVETDTASRPAGT